MYVISGCVNSSCDKDIISKMLDKMSSQDKEIQLYCDKHCMMGEKAISNNAPVEAEITTICHDTIVFSGFISNYEEIKCQLNAQGTEVETAKSSELVLKAFGIWGKDAFAKLDGSFSVAIWNSKEEELLIVRDGWGIKPVYYYATNEEFVFASRIKGVLEHPSVKKEFNDEILAAYLCFNSVPTLDTFVKNVSELEPGYWMTFKKGEIQSGCFFAPEFKPVEQGMDEVSEKIKDAFEDSVKKQIDSVEFGSFLSGGVDSSYMVSVAKPENTYTIGYSQTNFDESKYAKELADELGIKNNLCLIDGEQYLKVFKDAVACMDEPIADPAVAVLYIGAQNASKDVDVILSGEGADELFGGYNSYLEETRHRKYMQIPYWIRHMIYLVTSVFPENRRFNFYKRRGQKLENFHIGIDRVFWDKDAKNILKVKKSIHTKDITKKYYNKAKGFTQLQKRQYIDFPFWLINDFIHAVVASASAFGMQARFPFLGKPVYNVAMTLSDDMKINTAETKLALRKAAEKVVPTDAPFRRKLGFPVPLREWIKQDNYYSVIKEAFTSENAEKFFKTNKLMELLDDHRSGKRDTYKKVWTVYTFLVWYDIYFS